MTPTISSQVDRLLSQLESDRRKERRYPFVFPVAVHGPEAVQDGVSTDISPRGIGIILKQPYPPQTIARLVITCKKGPISVKARFVWALGHTGGMIRSGWEFLGTVDGGSTG